MTPSNDSNTASVHQKQPLAKVAISVAGKVGLFFTVLSSMAGSFAVLRLGCAQETSPAIINPQIISILFITAAKFRVLCRF